MIVSEIAVSPVIPKRVTIVIRTLTRGLGGARNDVLSCGGAFSIKYARIARSTSSLLSGEG